MLKKPPPSLTTSPKTKSIYLSIVLCLVIAAIFSLLSLKDIQTYFSDLFHDNLDITINEFIIDSVDVFVYEPEADAIPVNSATADGSGYYCSSVVWDPADNPFKIGVDYSVYVTVDVLNGYSFSDDLISATVNGHSATILSYSLTQVTLSYQFHATIAPVINFSAQTVFCSAANNQTSNRTYYVAAPADTATTFTLKTTTTTKHPNGSLVTNVDTIPNLLFDYSNGANNVLSADCNHNQAVINIPAGFVGNVEVIIHSQSDPDKKTEFNMVISSVESTIAATIIPGSTYWAANIHNAVFVAGDWEWRVLDKNLGINNNNDALIMSMHTHDTFMTGYYTSASAPAYQTSTVRLHAINQYNNNPIFNWAYSYSVEPNKTSWTQTTFAQTTVETASSGVLTKDYGNGYDGCFLLTRNDLSIEARGFIATGYNTSANQNGKAETSRQFTKTDGSFLPYFGTSQNNSHFWTRTHYNGSTGQELNANGGWGTGQTNASFNRYYSPAMIIRYNTQINSVAVSVTAPSVGSTPDNTAYNLTSGYSCGLIVWNPNHQSFEKNVPYTATITLTADNGYAFASSLATATINGNEATITGNNGNQITLSYSFTDYKIEKDFGPTTGGNTITVYGIDYGPNTVVSIDDKPCNIKSVATSGYSLKCKVPAGTFGLADVKVTDENNKTTIMENAYTYNSLLTGISPNFGPIGGYNGDPNQLITINGDGFLTPAKIPGIDPAYVNANAQDNWVNPKFSSATATSPINDPFGGVITSTGLAYSSRNAYRLFDKSYSSSSGNWQVTVNGSPNITATYTLPVGKYINLQTIKMYNGYYSPVKLVEFFAGSASDGVSLTGIFATNTETSTTAYTQYNIPVTTDIWTNQITVKIYPPAWLNTNWVSIQELIYGGRSLDLTPLGLQEWPTFFSMEDITETSNISVITIGDNPCEYEVISDKEIIVKAPASTLPNNQEGTVNVIVQTISGTNVLIKKDISTDYSYCLEINSLNLKITEPENGETPTTTTTSNDPAYICEEVSWDPIHEYFVPEELYTAFIKLTATNGYMFTDNMTTTINGNTATIFYNTGLQAVISYQFTEIPNLEEE